MERSKLMTPLFHNSFFNREGRRMRAVFIREITNGVDTYRLWRSAGKPDLEYPRTESDKYILHAEINGYLLPLGMTEFYMIHHCGFDSAVKKLYGGSEARERQFDALRRSGRDDDILAALNTENKEIERYGSDPARQTDYIQNLLQKQVNTYLESKRNGGMTFPDFAGALVLNELDCCAALSTVYKSQQREKEQARMAQAEAENKAFCEERNSEAEQVVSKALQVIRCGGVLENETVTFYRSRYDSSSCSIFNYLMRQYHVDVPLRTQGWINDKLLNATIEGGSCRRLQFLRSKGSRGSQKFFEYMDALIRAVTEQAPDKAAAA